MKRAIRLLLMGTSSHYGREVTKGAHRYCRSHGEWEYHMEGDNSPETVKRCRDAIQNWKADGIIAFVYTDRMEKLVWTSGLPTVIVSCGRHIALPTVKMDSLALGRMAAKYFLETGFRNFAFCALTNELQVRDRCEGFRKKLALFGFPCSVFADQYSARSEVDWAKNRKRMDQWLLSLKKPVAMLCMYDMRAQEIVIACRKHGISVPDDVAILGAGNDEMICDMTSPPLSSVDPDIQRIGYEAVRLLHQILRGKKVRSIPLLIPPRRVITRQSSDIIAVDDPDIAAAMRYIRDHAHQALSVKQLLQQIPISRKAMERRFQKLIGRSPKTEILHRRFERIKMLLTETDLPITAVTSQSGYIDHQLFARSFRRYVGMTPTQFRRMNRLPH